MPQPHHPLPGVINAPQMRLVNRSAILELIRRDSPIARSEIGRRLGLSLPTVMRIVDELIDEKLVRPTGDTEWSSGRRRELLEYDKDGQAVIGVDFGQARIYAALANIGGEILHETSLDMPGWVGETGFDLMIGLIRQLLDAPRKEGQRLRGIAVGLYEPGREKFDFTLWQKLEESFHLPVFIESAVHLMTLSESWFGSGRGANHMVLIQLGERLRAGIMIDGALYRGLGAQAGQVIGTTKDRSDDEPGFFSSAGILERARRLLEGQRPPERLQSLTCNDVLTATRWDEPWALEILDEAAGELSRTVVEIAALLDPELIVLASEMTGLPDLLMPRVVERVKAVLQREPCLAVSQLGSRGVVLGAVPLIEYHTSDHFLIRRLS